MKHRILAHEIVYGGSRYRLHIAEYDSDTGRLTITPFVEETADTRFYPGTVEVTVTDRKMNVKPVTGPT
ncbi:MAG: hypothetical protein K2K40_06880 [Paramuribaculum sp.]|nr:hypothetical protein [Candidatus Amulumruptor sp.]MDE6544791.1 hypothetical protein [Paramuribaculum sp.]MDE6588044.1 hypothetical protein [Paramuribaculum sp.]MDE7151954.1 hypothetical protein [Candidatus Amulumruptor sp.]MDE7237435.1 hypothetical protein [Paramuribaculum sp.]